MRSTIKDRDFYCKRIEATRKLQEKIELRLSSGEVQLDRQLAVKEMLFSQYLHLAILEYSSGMELELISVDYNKALHLLSTAWPLKSPEEVEIPDYLKDWYVKFIWIIVFGNTLQIPANDREMVIATWRKGGYRDWLIEYLLSPWDKIDPAVSNMIFPKPYASLKMAVEETDPQKRSAILRHYLEKEWYPGHKGVYWHDNHKSKHDTFFGYWSFEAAAVVKIAGIDDSSFRDHPYYPKDMLG